MPQLVHLREWLIGKKTNCLNIPATAMTKNRYCLVANNSMGILGTREIATDSLGYGSILPCILFCHVMCHF